MSKKILDVVCAESGSIAMQMLEERQFDGIIMEFICRTKTHWTLFPPCMTEVTGHFRENE